jgi:hypothetical protein
MLKLASKDPLLVRVCHIDRAYPFKSYMLGVGYL